jgi:hypothetical protein
VLVADRLRRATASDRAVEVRVCFAEVVQERRNANMSQKGASILLGLHPEETFPIGEESFLRRKEGDGGSFGVEQVLLERQLPHSGYAAFREQDFGQLHPCRRLVGTKIPHPIRLLPPTPDD